MENKKAILVLDMPETCCDCEFSGYSSRGIPLCSWKQKELDSFCYKPNWCPLKLIPEKIASSENLLGDWANGFISGWNDCIDEILGE